MSSLTSWIVPCLICAAALGAAFRGVDVLPCFINGAKGGIRTCLKMLPSLVAMLTAIHMLRASGLLSAIVLAVSPLLSALGIPQETAPLIFIRPLSGSGALAVGAELMARYGPDSLIGRTAAVTLGSTETTFYVSSVYFGSLGIKRTRYAIPAALCADLAGFVGAAFFTRLLMG